MDLLLRGGRVLGPSGAPGAAAGPGHDAAADVRITDGVVAEIGPGLRGGREVRVDGLWVLPGLVDLRAHLREPGAEHKEDLASGSRAAAAGGFTTVCAMPDTSPINDHRAVTDLIIRRAAEVGLARIHPLGAVSRGLAGERFADVADMKAGGIVAVTDAIRCVHDAAFLRRALEYADTFGLPLVQHAEDPQLVEGGAIDEGPIATRLGLRAQPALSETAIVARDLELVAWTGARYHVAHVSAARTVELVRDAKRRGLPVTAEVSALHLTLTTTACATYDPATRLSPPLRSEADRQALVAGVADGTIDAIVSDHAPQALTDKEVELEAAAPGAVGLETVVPLVLALVESGALPLARAVDALTRGAAACFGLDAGVLAPGAAADVTVLDPARAWTVRPGELVGKSKNTPLAGAEVTGRAVLTLCGGRVTLDRDGRLS
ncbi:MAG TPA: dihydroorotase [Kofleriaceae bacterium]|nr:dihydroorotase [Kofleriaceae bacterium]